MAKTRKLSRQDILDLIRSQAADLGWIRRRQKEGRPGRDKTYRRVLETSLRRLRADLKKRPYESEGEGPGEC